jgi:hypothetical protein
LGWHDSEGDIVDLIAVIFNNKELYCMLQIWSETGCLGTYQSNGREREYYIRQSEMTYPRCQLLIHPQKLEEWPRLYGGLLNLIIAGNFAESRVETDSKGIKRRTKNLNRGIERIPSSKAKWTKCERKWYVEEYNLGNEDGVSEWCEFLSRTS